MPKIKWTTDGTQDKFLEKLIREGKITKETSPGSIKNEYPRVFDNFTTAVIRNHLNHLKRRNGMFCKCDIFC